MNKEQRNMMFGKVIKDTFKELEEKENAYLSYIKERGIDALPQYSFMISEKELNEKGYFLKTNRPYEDDLLKSTKS